jgi:hypothetical protein
MESKAKAAFYLFFIFCCISCSRAAAAVSAMGLKQAMKSNAVIVEAYGNGGAMGKCLRLHMANTTCKTLKIKIDPALIFDPVDGEFQKLVVVGGDSVMIEPDKKVDVTLQTFCGNAPKSCPTKDLRYHFAKQGDSAMILTMKYIREHELYNHLGQRTVWTFTNPDDHSINTIYSLGDPDASQKLMEYVAKLRHLEVPKYYSYYEIQNRPGEPMIKEGTGKEIVEMSWGNEGYRNMYVIVYREDGTVYKSNAGNEHCSADMRRFIVTFDSEKERGFYYVELRDDHNRLWQRKDVAVGIDWNKRPARS